MLKQTKEMIGVYGMLTRAKTKRGEGAGRRQFTASNLTPNELTR